MRRTIGVLLLLTLALWIGACASYGHAKSLYDAEAAQIREEEASSGFHISGVDAPGLTDWDIIGFSFVLMGCSTLFGVLLFVGHNQPFNFRSNSSPGDNNLSGRKICAAVVRLRFRAIGMTACFLIGVLAAQTWETWEPNIR